VGQIGAIILATSFIQLANGFFTTLVSLRFGLEAFDPAFEGLVMSSYFVGFTIGAVACGPLIQRIGHIRSYAAFAGITIAAAAIMAVNTTLWTWGISRIAVGFGCVGVFVTTESWLNSKASPELRGRTFASYMIGTFLALALGQMLIGYMPIDGSAPFNVIVVLFAVAIVIVSSTYADPPAVVPEHHLPFLDLVRAAPLGIAGCVVAGMVSSTFYAVGPAWMLLNHISQSTISLVMLAAVLGGLGFQVPIGRFSDRHDRRLVLSAIALGFTVAAIALAVLPHTLGTVLPIAVVLGGFMSTLYPVSVAHTMDNMAGERLVAISSRVILASGIGSIIGPFTGSWIMGRHEINGVLYCMAGATALLGILAATFAVRSKAARQDRPFQVMTPQAVPIAVATEVDR
jgi:MFS family permease